jgi:arylsulfatase A
LKDDLQQPHRMGFDEYCLYGWHEGPWYYRPHIWHNGRLRTDIRDRYGPDVICECLLEFIERNKSARFFALYSMSLCHAETNDLDIPAPVGPLGRYDSYAEMVGKMDERVGRVVSTLDRLALRENTLVLFTTDNGTATHNLIDAEGDQYIYEPVVSRMGTREISGGKATLTDWGTRVPLIANWPGTIKPRQVTDNLVSVTDILPTLANVAAATLPDRVPIDGQSIPGLVRSFSTARKWVFAEHEGRCFLRNHQWKLYNDGLFYDMNADPDEKHSLGTDALSPAASTAHHELQQTLIGLAYQPAGK